MTETKKNAWHNVYGITPQEMKHAEEEALKRYGDIIDAPRPASPNRRKASINSRAAQFAPFAALTGFEGEIREEARYTESRHELNEDEKAELDASLHEIEQVMEEEPEVIVTIFEEDPTKPGGFYRNISKRVRKIDVIGEVIQFTDKTKADFADILQIRLVSR
ncbi:MAG: hypothetical protein J6S26_02645 [Solobacterium sp.]|nr:hypothetical protein [Solobacterium sp.]